MTQLDALIPPAELAAAIDAGLVTRKQHPHLPLSIYTYTRTAQYSRQWTTATIRCRGLIADDVTGEIIAWPFPKFFNVGEHGQGHDYAPPLPDDEPFEVYDKVDGSLAIVFWHAGKWRAASKGSFTSEQALWTQTRLDDRDTDALWPGATYLAETVYPSNRIVVDYGDREDLVLLAAYEVDGTEIPLRTAAVDWLEIGNVVRTWPAMPLDQLVKLTAANTRPDGQPTSGMHAEGYVIRYASGLRAKAKLAEYVRLHKVLTGITERDIWQYLGIRKFGDQPAKHVAKALGTSVMELSTLGRGRDPLDALLEQVPDEFDAWVHGVIDRLERDHDALEARVQEAYWTVDHLGHDRGVFARAVQQRIDDPAVRACMFLLLDGKPTGLHLWRAIRPETSAPFTADDE